MEIFSEIANSINSFSQKLFLLVLVYVRLPECSFMFAKIVHERSFCSVKQHCLKCSAFTPPLSAASDCRKIYHHPKKKKTGPKSPFDDFNNIPQNIQCFYFRIFEIEAEEISNVSAMCFLSILASTFWQIRLRISGETF